MGGRGSASGMSDKGKKYGQEYRALFRVDNIKFIKQIKPGPASVPFETMSADKDRVYALISNEGILKTIVFYDKSGKKRRRIDLDHSHNKHKPHIHAGYEHSTKYVPMNKKDIAYVNKIERIWREENGK